MIPDIPLSVGIYEGSIRVVFDLLNANLPEGEIMVTESMNPAWTPLFPIAKGLIREYGGSASHGSIIARKYGIPAVVGISSATGIPRDSQRIRIMEKQVWLKYYSILSIGAIIINNEEAKHDISLNLI